MSEHETRDGDAERLEAERLGRIRTSVAADRRVRDADQDSRALGMPNDMLSVRDRALRQACAELDSRDAALREYRTEIARAIASLQNIFKTAAPQCEPFNALLNICTQIDNLVAGQKAEIKLRQVEALRFRHAFGALCAVLDIPSHPLDWDRIRREAEEKLLPLREKDAEIDRLNAVVEAARPVAAATAERALIVTWLRMVAEDTFCKDDPEYGAVMDAADCIERGDHAQPAAPAERGRDG